MLAILPDIHAMSSRGEEYLYIKHLNGCAPTQTLLMEMLHAKRKWGRKSPSSSSSSTSSSTAIPPGEIFLQKTTQKWILKKETKQNRKNKFLEKKRPNISNVVVSLSRNLFIQHFDPIFIFLYCVVGCFITNCRLMSSVFFFLFYYLIDCCVCERGTGDWVSVCLSVCVCVCVCTYGARMKFGPVGGRTMQNKMQRRQDVWVLFVLVDVLWRVSWWRWRTEKKPTTNSVSFWEREKIDPNDATVPPFQLAATQHFIVFNENWWWSSTRKKQNKQNQSIVGVDISFWIPV